MNYHLIAALQRHHERERRRRVWFHDLAKEALTQLIGEFIFGGLFGGESPFRHDFTTDPTFNSVKTMAAADNRQGISLFSPAPPEWVDSKGNPQKLKTTVPDHLRGSIGLIFERPVPEKQISYSWFTLQDFKVVEPGSAAFLINDCVS